MNRICVTSLALAALACNGPGPSAASEGMSGSSSAGPDSAGGGTGRPDPSTSGAQSATGDGGVGDAGDADDTTGSGSETGGPGCGDDRRLCDGVCVPIHDASVVLGDIEVVEASSLVAGVRALEIAPNGEPLLLVQHDDRSVWIGERDDGEWSLQSIFGGAMRLDDVAAAFGPDGVPTVKVASFRDGDGIWSVGSPSPGGEWTFESDLSRTNTNNSRVDLAYDDAGALHTLYARSMAVTTSLEVWVYPGEGRAAPLDPSLLISNLVVDAEGVLHLAYALSGDGVFHTMRVDGTWVADRITTFPQNSGPAGLNLAKTPDERMVVNFVRPTNGEHVIATQADDGWDFESALGEEGIRWSTLRIDDTGARHLWASRRDRSVVYARDNGAAWEEHELGDHSTQAPWLLSVTPDGSAAHLAWSNFSGRPRQPEHLYRRISITPTCG